MIKKFNKFINCSIILSILFAIVGSLIIFFPKTSSTIISYLLAATLIINGILLVTIDLKLEEKYIPIYNIPSGILSIILGTIIFFYPNTFKIIIPITLGIWFIISSIIKIQIALRMRNIKKAPWMATFIMAILTTICGIILIANPITSTLAITIFAGLMLLVYSITDIIDMIIFKEKINDIIDTFKKITKPKKRIAKKEAK